MGRYETVRTDSAGSRGREKIHSSRWPAVRERGYPSGHSAQQNLERFDSEVADDAWLRRALRARLRLSWIADRVARRTETRREEERHAAVKHSSRMSRVRRECFEATDARFSTARDSWRVGQSLHHDVGSLR